jgi:hypothetical protein
MTPETEQMLVEEARFLAKSTYRIEDLSLSVVKRYCDAHQVLGIALGAGLNKPSYELARRKVDLDSLEIVLRGTHSDLSAKFYLLSYLLEAQGRTLPRFLDLPVRGADLVGFVFYSGFLLLQFFYKILKGHCLRIYHGL